MRKSSFGTLIVVALCLAALLMGCSKGDGQGPTPSVTASDEAPAAERSATSDSTQGVGTGAAGTEELEKADRSDCEEIRGTAYRSESEQEFFLSTCIDQPPSGGGLSGLHDQALVTRVIDGDTIEIEGGARVRYIGMDTPETPGDCYSQEAAARNAALVLNQVVELEKDVSETDRFGRLLRYVYLDGAMVNEVLVAEGYAQVATFPPDVKHVERLLAAQRAAAGEGRGLWSGCEAASTAPTPPTTTSPPASACPQGCTSPPQGCVIKGNISQSSGEKIYHVPGGGSYEATRISPEYGERWFCTEQEAVANGWRKARN